jgi:hypothetical protein
MHAWGRLGLILTAASVAPAGPLRAAPGAAAPARLPAVEIDFAALAPLTRTVMRRELAAVLAPAALLFDWRSAGPAEETDRGELRVVLLASTGVGSDRGALGSTARRGIVPPTIWLYVPNVAATLGLGHAGVAAGFEAQRRLGVALGRVVAHELVHALAPAVPHAEAGLLRARMHAFQLTSGRPAFEGDCAASLAAGAQAWLASGGSWPRSDATAERSAATSPR